MLNQAVFCELTEKFAEIDFDGISRGAELAANFVDDSGFGVAEFEKFEHARSNRVQPEHLPLAYVEDDGSILVMG
jgi:hypothetical protein